MKRVSIFVNITYRIYYSSEIFISKLFSILFILHAELDVSGHCCNSSSCFHDILLRMAVAQWFQHEMSSSGCAASILIVPHVLVGLGGSFSSGRPCRFSAWIHSSIYDEYLGMYSVPSEYRLISSLILRLFSSILYGSGKNGHMCRILIFLFDYEHSRR